MSLDLPPAQQLGSGAPHSSANACAACRRRKVRCDKGQPCANCTRTHVECVYLPAQPRQRKNRSKRHKELLDRVRKLEGIIADMNLTEQGHQHSASPELDDSDVNVELETNVGSADPEGSDAISQLSEVFGRLEVRNGGSMWFSNSLTARLHAESDSQQIMITERCEDEYTPSPKSNPHPQPEPSDVFWQTDHRSFEPLIYAPPARQIPWYWEKFIELVDPFVKILHIPTTAPLFLNFNASTTPVDTQPLFFAICYSVACSLPPSACATVLQDDQRALIAKYKTATQRALGAARILATQELRVLQALVLLMSCAGGSEAEELWTLTGLVVRVAQHMGLHRDGGRHFAALVSPFAAEMRRRAWWQVCVLDLQVSEVRGAESTVLDLAFDTRMPANVRDEDVAPEMEALPAARKGCTEVTASLISFEVVEVLRKMARAAKKGAAGCSAVAFQQKVGILEDFTAKVEDEYLAHGVKRDGPLFHCCRALFRCLRARLLLLLYHPFRQLGRNAHLSQDAKDTLFLACLEALESWHFLSADPRFTARSTGFRANVLFQVLIFVLLQLCGGRNDALAERAWHMVMAAQLPHPDRSLEPRMRRIIGPGSRLLERAKRSREQQLQQRSSEAEFNAHLHPTTIPTTAVRSSATGSTQGLDQNALQGSGEGADAHAPPGGFDTLSADLAAFVEEFPGSYFMDIM